MKSKIALHLFLVFLQLSKATLCKLALFISDLHVCLHVCPVRDRLFLPSQVPPRCDRRRAGQPDQQPRGGGGHRQAGREDPAADHGAEGGHQQAEARADGTGHGLHGQ